MHSVSNRGLIIVGNMFVSTQGIRPVGGDIAVGLQTRGWDVMLTSSAKSPVLRLLGMLGSAMSLRRRYTVAIVDVFSGRAFFWAEVIVPLLQMMRKRVVLNLHGGRLPEFARANPRRIQRIMDKADAVVSPSGYLKRELNAYRRGIEIVPNPIDLTRYESRLRSNVRPHLIWVRAFHNIYNPEMAIRVISQLRSSIPELHLTMLGRDKHDGSLRRTQDLIDELSLSTNVTIVGPVDCDDVAGWHHQADIFVNTSTIDNTPVSIIEAMASGLIVISTNVGGVGDLITNGKDGLLVPDGDWTEMARAIQGVLENPVLANQLSANAITTSRRFDLRIVTDQWIELFNRLNDHGQSRDIVPL